MLDTVVASVLHTRLSPNDIRSSAVNHLLNVIYLSASATLDDISRSEAYKKTQETLSQAGQKTSAAFTTVGTVISKRLGDMRALPFSNSFSSNYSIRHSISMPAMRNSATFKSFEDRVGNLKYKVVGPRGNGEAVGSPTDTTPTQENPPF
ncbi:tpd52 like 2b [Cottoperca gobio]|uniref:Tpd52 like 2b n=1 Tax=Cottoperca gobio TaxID=56716 RepID=A0A6J2P9N4_COTGO|nr:tumor protein D54-like [Cottoperca gobio]